MLGGVVTLAARYRRGLRDKGELRDGAAVQGEGRVRSGGVEAWLGDSLEGHQAGSCHSFRLLWQGLFRPLVSWSFSPKVMTFLGEPYLCCRVVFRGDLLVAVKVIYALPGDLFPGDEGYDPSIAKAFDEAEVMVMAQMRHPRLVLFYGAGSDDKGQRFIVTEFMEGGDLKGVLDDKARELPWGWRLQALHDIAEGMLFLHSQDLMCVVLHSSLLQNYRVITFGTLPMQAPRFEEYEHSL